MQSPRWYLRRLASMSGRELLWRCGGKVQALTDRLLLGVRGRPRSLARIIRPEARGSVTNRAALGEHLLSDDLAFPPEHAEPWRRELVTAAESIVSGHLDLFDLGAHLVGEDINWNYEHKARKATPLCAASAIDYRDARAVGDCKFVWEPNRHHHLVVLGRAYRITGDPRFAETVWRHIESWIHQCPFGRGMNWRSGLELSVRLINWVWALDLIETSSVMTTDRRVTVWRVVEQHLREVARHYSRYSSANNHLIGEAAGVFVASSYFTGFRGAKHWRDQSRGILTREIERQTYADGATREQATGYHLFTLAFFLHAGLAARNSGEDFGHAFWDRFEKMFEFLAVLTEGGDTFPSIGDGDDGYVLDLGGRADPARVFLSIGAVLFERSDFKRQAGAFAEPAFWLFGPEGKRRFDSIDNDATNAAISSHALPSAGYYLLQSGQAGARDRISAIFDCGDLGFLSIAAHGHADALSLILRVGGAEVLVDPGTYDYFTYGPWRTYFRSTRAHNTITIDGADQSEMLGKFLWGRRARARCLTWKPSGTGGSVSGEHDGYRCLPDPVMHRRTVTLHDDGSTLLVFDEIEARAKHVVRMYWHFAEGCRVSANEGGGHAVVFEHGRVQLEMDGRLQTSLVSGRTEPILGWVSRGYHQKSPCTTLVGRCTIDGSVSLVTRFGLSE